jgi:hypothetical protein
MIFPFRQGVPALTWSTIRVIADNNPHQRGRPFCGRRYPAVSAVPVPARSGGSASTTSMATVVSEARTREAGSRRYAE